MDWLARELETELQIQATTDGFQHNLEYARQEPNWPMPPEGSRLVLRRQNQTQLDVQSPGKGLGRITNHVLTFIFVTCIVFLIVLGVSWFADTILFPVIFGCIAFVLVAGNATYQVHSAMVAYHFVGEQGLLSIAKTGLFGTRRFEQAQSSLSSVQIEDSGIRVNQKTLLQIVIRSGDEKLIVMRGKNLHELRFVACHLNDWMKNGKP